MTKKAGGISECGMSDVRDFPKTKNEVTYGSGELTDLLSGVAEGTQSAYRTAWVQWAQFVENRPEGVWIEKQEPKWGERLIDWILFEARILGVRVGTIRSKISAIRYWNVLSGYPDFSKRAGRYKQVLKSIARKLVVKRNYPFNLELLQITNQKLGEPDSRTTEQNAILAALLVGFFFLIRVSEIENLRACDAKIEKQEDGWYLESFLTGSKTDQYNQGDRKRLKEVGGDLCPIKATMGLTNEMGYGPKSIVELFPANIRSELTTVMKTVASENGVNPARVGPRSLRSGGANAMFVAGYDTEVIKRWGRWKSPQFTTYLWNDDRILVGLGSGMMLAAGLLPQLQMQSDNDNNKERFFSNGRAGGKGGRGRAVTLECCKFLKQCRDCADMTGVWKGKRTGTSP